MQTYLLIDEFQQMASDGFKLILRQARSFDLSVILANQSESDLMSKQTSRLLDTVRANTQIKIFLTANDLNTIKFIGGMSDERLSASSIRFYGSYADYALCWITRDSGFAAFGGECFGMKTYFHITQEEFTRRNDAAWPAPSESTIVATRSLDGITTLRQGDVDASTKPGADPEEIERGALVVPANSLWAKRLTKVFSRRFGVKNGAL